MAFIIKELQNNIPQTGKLEWISRRPARRAAVEELPEIRLSPETGLEGDHYSGKSQLRQVTLIQQEHLQAISQLLKKEIQPGQTRRNLVVSGINLLALSGHQFSIGETLLKFTGRCYPCSRMEENLGPGGYQAMRGHGGINAQIIRGGTIRLGDPVRMIPETD
ncbi:MAG: MOSC domain-containing protein [Bacteroidetes bacterium]|nr:MOSC domain-containing protein [Bacteroidota bacterium]